MSLKIYFKKILFLCIYLKIYVFLFEKALNKIKLLNSVIYYKSKIERLFKRKHTQVFRKFFATIFILIILSLDLNLKIMSN